MTPEIQLLSTTTFRWVSFRATIDKALNLRPDSVLNRIPIDFSVDAQVLLNIAAYHGLNISNPLQVLRDLPQYFMGHLSYSFMIACEENSWDELRTPQITQVMRGDILIVTGSLEQWYDTIILNILRDLDYSFEAVFIIDKILLILERERGLGLIFEKYRKKMQVNQTFLLEKK